METLRESNGFTLNKGDGMAKGLFNVSHHEKGLLSFWFDEDEKNRLLSLTDKEFEFDVRLKCSKTFN
jgi:hypothetical protein